MSVPAVPQTPAPDPCDFRTQSAPVLIRTGRGEWYTAQWTLYEDTDYAPVWELIGRDCLQLERDEVVEWFDCAAVAEVYAQRDALLEALQAVVSVADRKSAEFDLARDAIAKATGEQS